MMSWGGMSWVTVRRLTRSSRSTMGMIRIRPGPLGSLVTRPRRNRTPRWYSGRILTDARRMVMRTTAAMARPIAVSVLQVCSNRLDDKFEALYPDYPSLLPGLELAHRGPDGPPGTVQEDGSVHAFHVHQRTGLADEGCCAGGRRAET